MTVGRTYTLSGLAQHGMLRYILSHLAGGVIAIYTEFRNNRLFQP